MTRGQKILASILLAVAFVAGTIALLTSALAVASVVFGAVVLCGLATFAINYVWTKR